jgi:hypothetical protein
MKNVVFWLWPLVPCVLLSGLVHTTDADIEGISELVTSPVLVVSVLVWSVPAVIVAYLLSATYVNGGIRWYLAAAVPTSALLGVLLATLGSTAQNASQFAWSAAGSGLVVLTALSLAALPGVAIFTWFPR